MRTSFKNHAEVCHIWAQQKQAFGKAGNIFFRDSCIFSYGEHFTAAKIYSKGKLQFALVNSRRYSTSTGQHLGHVRDALQGLMPYFESPDVHNPKTAVKYLDEQAKGSVSGALKRIKVKDKRSIEWEFERIHDAYKEANRLRKLLGMAEKWPRKVDLDKVQTHLEFRLKRYHELNTPEMHEKRENERQRRQALAILKHERLAQEKIEKFRKGEYVHLPELPYALLRIQGDEVITSRGARVPLADAMKLYRAIVAGKNVEGVQAGSYTVREVLEMPDDTRIIIGCHAILLSEAAQVLGLKVA